VILLRKGSARGRNLEKRGKVENGKRREGRKGDEKGMERSRGPTIHISGYATSYALATETDARSHS